MRTKLTPIILIVAPAIGLATLINGIISLFLSVFTTQPFSIDKFRDNFINLSDTYTIQYAVIFTASLILFIRFPFSKPGKTDASK